MKKKKRLLAFVMAILLVITSVTIDYRLSEAATNPVSPKIIIKVAAAYKDKTAIIDISNTDKTYSNEISGKTVTETDITDDNGTTTKEYQIVLETSDLSGDNALEAGSGYNVAVTIEEDVCVYSGSASITAPAADADPMAVECDVDISLSSVKKVTVDMTGYEYVNVTGASFVEKKDNNIIFDKEGSAFASGDSFTIEAKKDGIKYEGTVTVNNAMVTAVWKATQFKLNITNNSGAQIQYKKEGDNDNKYSYDDSTVFETDTHYQLIITASSRDKIINVSGIGGTGNDYSESENGWNQEFSSEQFNDAKTITISEKDPEVESLKITTSKIVPEIETEIEYTCTMEANYPVSKKGVSIKLYEDEACTTELSTSSYSVNVENNQKIYVTYAYDKDTSKIYAKIIVGNKESAAQQLDINCGEVVYNQDFKLDGNDGNIYSIDGKYIYHNGGNIILCKKTYDQYRYRKGSNPFCNFADIQDDTKIDISDSNSPLVIQMRSTEAFGTTGEITLFKDSVAPVIEKITGDDVNVKETGGSYAMSNQSSLKIKAYDVNGNDEYVSPVEEKASGLKRVYYTYDITSEDQFNVEFDDNNGQVEIGGENLKCPANGTIYVYAEDNVGNVSDPLEIKYTIDNDPPVITVGENSEYFVKSEEEKGTYYYYSFSRSGKKSEEFDIVISDDNFDENNTTVYCGNSLVETKVKWEKKDDGYHFKYEISNAEEQYKIKIESTDAVGNSTGEKIFTIVVDNTSPSGVSAIAEPIALPDEGRFGDLKNKYIAYNMNSKLVVKFEDANINTASAVTTKLTGSDQTIECKEVNSQDHSYTAVNSQDHSYTAEYEFSDSDLAETLAFNNDTKENNTVTVTDKAGNKVSIPICTADSVDLTNTEKNIAIIKNEIELKGLTADVVKEGSEFFAVSEDATGNKRVSGVLMYAGADAACVSKDFVKIYIVKSEATDNNITDDNIVVKIDSNSVSVEDGKIKFSADASNLSSDNEYKIIAFYYDIAAADEKCVISEKYIYDITPPVLEISSNEREGTISYVLEESYPDFENFVITISANNNENETVQDQISNNLAEMLRGSWKINENDNSKHTFTLQLPEEGIYQIKVTPIDQAGNKGEQIDTGKITYDKTAPVMDKLSVSEVYNTENTEYSQFSRGKATINFEITELVSETVSLTCKATDADTKKTTRYENIQLTRDGSKFRGSLDINADFRGTLTFELSDENNHSATVVYEKNGKNIGLVVEGEEKHTLTSNVSIETLNEQDAKNGIFNESVKLALAASDTYSGIRQVEYIINGASTMVSSNDTGNITYNWNTNAEIAATKENEGNDIKVKVVVTDNAGYTRETEASYKIDITAPVIRVSYDNNSPLNERYYNATRTATIEIDEYNFDLSGVVLNVKRDGVSMNIAPNFRTDSVVKTDTNGKPYYTYIMNLPFAEDGDYEFSLTVTDAAGNVASYGQTDTFTIDKTNPEMSITYDNNEPYSGQYYGEGRTATIKVTEHNFDANDVVVNLSATVDGVGTTTPSVGAFTTNGDVHTAVISFNNDADYTISASCKDLAGNDGNSIDEQAFTVDLTAPEIEITGVDADTSYVDSVNPVVKVTDGNYDTDGVTITIVGGKHGTAEIDRDVAEADHGQTFSYADLQHTQENDDYYVITATAVDKAGHETEETVSYRVNRFGSIYLVNDELQTAIDQYYAPASDKYAIIEENVDELDSYTVTYTIDNEIVNLEEDRDYTVSHTTNKDDWQQYEYKLAEETFSREGIYNISISSKDAVGNVSDNKSKDMEMEFCIDNTKPVCIISGVSENQEFEQGVSANIVVEAYDNIKFADMKIMVNGEELKTEKDMVDGKVSFTIAPVKGDQTLTVICHDAAGNEELQEIHFSFDVGALGSHAWLIILLVVLLVLIATILIFFIIAKRRKTDRN